MIPGVFPIRLFASSNVRESHRTKQTRVRNGATRGGLFIEQESFAMCRFSPLFQASTCLLRPKGIPFQISRKRSSLLPRYNARCNSAPCRAIESLSFSFSFPFQETYYFSIYPHRCVSPFPMVFPDLKFHFVPPAHFRRASQNFGYNVSHSCLTCKRNLPPRTQTNELERRIVRSKLSRMCERA